MRILLIDDEVRKAQALVAYFQEICEWETDVATGPDRAVELLKSEYGGLYDVIILDVMMDPGKVLSRYSTDLGRDTGLMLLDSIARITNGRVPIVLYTARTDLAHLGSDKRVAAYVTKPISGRELARRIEDLTAPSV